LIQSLLKGNRAVPVRVAAKTFATKVFRSLLTSRLDVRIVTTLTTESSFARSIALAQRHGVIVFEQRGLGIPRVNGGFENHRSVIERGAGTEVAGGFVGLKSSIVPLVTVHTNIIGQPGGELGRVHNGGIHSAGYCAARHPFFDVQLTRAMTPFTADTQLYDRRILIQSFPASYRLGSACVASNALGRDRQAEAQVLHLIVGR
jgi:hypothetical protein